MKRIIPFSILVIACIQVSFAQNIFNIQGLVGMFETRVPLFTFQCSQNPSNHELSISSNNAEQFDIRIANLQGQTVWEHKHLNKSICQHL